MKGIMGSIFDGIQRPLKVILIHLCCVVCVVSVVIK